ncbi:MAG: prepilin peptidase [Candidatus Nealsonbacteria bacterium]|nr:prepilin peptidase [Candidatus Nealsonbacteria bacterium]
MEDLFSSSIVFIFGLTIGSFLNSVIYRLEKGKNIIIGRSFCPECNHTLGWQDLIPIFSFVFLKGKCRYCLKPISLQYPLVEIATASLFFLIFRFQLSAFHYLLSTFLIVIFVYDLKHYLIPDKVIYPAIATVILYQLFTTRALMPLVLGFWFGILPSLFFLAIVLLSKERWMGLGDFKLAVLMGLLLGWPSILAALFLAFFSGAIIGVSLIVSGRKTLKSELPFGPFLIVGTIISLLWGQDIIYWYLNILT